MARKNVIVEQYGRMWPREVFDCLIPSENGSGRRVILGGARCLPAPVQPLSGY